ncbi:hypothetical protein [Streptomonospora wellingtoniae]|uniref:Uncharacterized protein n=1 Tax=Streptomonospora wellingtoniae TaxID=3075544 RepID=A0ABU2KP11_9ACTN|nr:hypothetical protein [Streptomonospora sp. DSM 45055]MDT0301011.1 hypothetical protein [Streptomonospora sp. DSM 45055]
MHPDFLQAAADHHIARLREDARQSTLRRALRSARVLDRRARGRDEEPGGGIADALPEQPPAVPHTAHTVAAPRPAVSVGGAPEHAADRAPTPC